MVVDGADGSPSTVADSAGCIPINCAAQGAQCGRVSDGCNGVLDCGSCEAGVCGGGGANRCGTNPCIPKTCNELGAQCGRASDGCGNLLDCGNGCVAPLTCGAGGMANRCGCTKSTCSSLGASCGAIADGCGGMLDCGGCNASRVCVANACQRHD
jgi:hypothetical protein